MAALVPIEVLGFAPGDPVTSVQMNLVNTQIPKAPNFVDGGATYNPAALLQVGGAGLQWNATSLFASTSTTNFEGAANVQSATGRLYVNTSGQIVVQTSGEIVIQSGGAMTWEDGALITAEDGSTFNLQDGSVLNLAGIMNFGATSEIHGDPTLMSGAELTAASGSIVNLGGTTTYTGGTNPQLSPARAWTRRSLRMCATTNVADVNHLDGSSISVSGDFIHTILVNSTVLASATLLELDDLPDGQTISSVQVRTRGDQLAPTTFTRDATYKVIRWTDETTLDVMSATVTDSHNAGNWTTALNQSIAITSHQTIDRSYRYAVQVINHKVDNDDEMLIIAVVATGTATSIRV